MNRKKTLLISLVVVLVGVVGTVLIFVTEPEAERGGAVKQTAMLVEVVPAERGTYRPVIVATGTVEPSQDVLLSPRVSGEVVRRAPAFTPGGYVRRGEPLLQLDPSDYENALEQRRSDLTQAMTDLAVEQGRQDVARQDYEALGTDISQENEALVLREPQLEAARARVASAQAALEQAELALRRTAITAPFDAHILTREVSLGSQVAPGDVLGRLVGVDEYWVVVDLPLDKLRWLTFPSEAGGDVAGVVPDVRIRNRTGWPEGVYRTGRLSRQVGMLAEETRMARVLVTISDPHALEPANQGTPPLVIGSFVEARIPARTLEDVVRLDRDHVRDDETVWVMADSTLSIRDVQIVFEDATYAYVSDGLTDGDRVVTTNLSTVTEGAPLRLEGSGDAAQLARSAEPDSTTTTQ